MIIRKVAIELTEKQYEKLCQMAASAGKTVEMRGDQPYSADQAQKIMGQYWRLMINSLQLGN